jgi:uncharacterized membrane protein
MKLGTNRISARSMTIWVAVGFLVMVPFMWTRQSILALDAKTVVIGLMGGVANGLGNLAVFASLEKGAKASVAIPLTALYPLFTIGLATGLLHERPTTLQWVGIALALVGGVMLSYEPEIPAAIQEK